MRYTVGYIGNLSVMYSATAFYTHFVLVFLILCNVFLLAPV